MWHIRGAVRLPDVFLRPWRHAPLRFSQDVPLRYNVRLCSADMSGREERGLRNRWLMTVAVLGLLAIVAPEARAQDGPEKGGHEIQFWTGGGWSTNGGVRDTRVWNAGFRYGWIL